MCIFTGVHRCACVCVCKWEEYIPKWLEKGLLYFCRWNEEWGNGGQRILPLPTLKFFIGVICVIKNNFLK